MTKFLYEIQNEWRNSLNIFPGSNEWTVIGILIDHIENQGKQLRELNKAIAKKNETITGLRSTIASLNANNINLLEKVRELNDGIRDSEDLSWKQKYDLAIKEKECAVNALQNKCKSLEHQIAAKDINIESVERARDCLREKIDALNKAVEFYKERAEYTPRPLAEDMLYVAEERCREAEKKLEKLEGEKKTIEKNFAYEMQVNKDLNKIINSKNDLLDKYMTKCNNLEHNYAEEVKMKEHFKTTCFRHEMTIVSHNTTIKDLKEKLAEYIRINATLRGKLVSISELTKE